MDCPDCGRPMAAGFLAAESYMQGVKWAAKKGRLGARGPEIVKPDRLGMVYLEGFRCETCRLLSLRY